MSLGSLQLPVHLALHLLLPLAAAWLLWRDRWRVAALIGVLANLVDLDHLLASPVYDPGRVSLGYHPLHSGWALGAYVLVALLAGRDSRWRMLALMLLLHMGVDALDAWVLG